MTESSKPADTENEESRENEEPPKAGSAKLTIVICLVLGVLVAGLIWIISSTEPEAQRSTETRETAMLVDVVEVQRGNFRPQISALGRVRPESEIQLSPRVSGEVIARSPNFTPGGFVAAGELLLKIDPADYENALQQRRSELAEAEASLKIEMGRQRIAESDLELLGEEVPAQARILALRQPQLDTAQAVVESAKAAVRQAELDLERTEIKAPLDVQVIARHIDIGSQVAPGDNLGRLVGQKTYWVLATVPLSSLPWIDRGPGSEGSPVTVRDRGAWPADMLREGTARRLIGTLDERTRLARVLVTVSDPLARLPENEGKPALILDSILEATITGKEIENVVRLERAYLREGDTAWVMDENNELRIAQLEIVFRDARYAYVRTGLQDGDEVVTTGLTTVSEGASLRMEDDNP
jgi:RND family efflux transporter MFP subunit